MTSPPASWSGWAALRSDLACPWPIEAVDRLDVDNDLSIHLLGYGLLLSYYGPEGEQLHLGLLLRTEGDIYYERLIPMTRYRIAFTVDRPNHVIEVRRVGPV